MKTSDRWIPYQDIDWDDKDNDIFNLDTRDFCVGYHLSKAPHNDFKVISKYPDFFFTKEELLELINRYFIESGGERDWRYFDFTIEDPLLNNWSMKYIRIWRTELGFMVCNRDNRALRKEILNYPVKLNKH